MQGAEHLNADGSRKYWTGEAFVTITADLHFTVNVDSQLEIGGDDDHVLDFFQALTEDWIYGGVAPGDFDYHIELKMDDG